MDPAGIAGLLFDLRENPNNDSSVSALGGLNFADDQTRIDLPGMSRNTDDAAGIIFNRQNKFPLLFLGFANSNPASVLNEIPATRAGSKPTRQSGMCAGHEGKGKKRQ